MVQQIEAIRTAAIIAVVTPGADVDPAVAVVENQTLGRGGQRPRDHVLGDANAEAIGPGPAADENVAGLFVMHVHTHPLQYLE